MSPQLRTLLLRPPVVIGATAVVAAAFVAYAFITVAIKPAAAYVHPTVGTAVEEVETTGTAAAAQEVDLSFQTGGRIASVRYGVGAHVPAGAVLASLSGADQKAQLEQAKAELALQQAKLASLQAGATAQALAASQTSVDNAQSALVAARQAVVQASQDAYVKSDDAVHNRIDQIFSNPRTANPVLDFSLTDSETQNAIVSGRVQMEQLLGTWRDYEATIATEDVSTLSMSGVVSATRGYLAQVSSYLDLVSGGLTEAIPTQSYPLATIQGYETSIATGRTNVSSDASALNTADTAERIAESSLASAKAQLAVTQQPAAAGDVAAQEASIAAAQASVGLAQAQADKTVITAPISGTITVDNAHAGATAAASDPLISMISDSRFQMETYVSQADLAKVAPGQGATVTLDAYPGVPLAGHVITIDPAATIQGGVASYKVTLQFDADDPRIRAGLSGSAAIITRTKENALLVPSSAVIRRGEAAFVLKRAASGDVLAPVTLGIVGATTTEIESGLSTTDSIRSFGSQ